MKMTSNFVLLFFNEMECFEQAAGKSRIGLIIGTGKEVSLGPCIFSGKVSWI